MAPKSEKKKGAAPQQPKEPAQLPPPSRGPAVQTAPSGQPGQQHESTRQGQTLTQILEAHENQKRAAAQAQRAQAAHDVQVLDGGQ
jgi:hypothetical protein